MAADGTDVRRKCWSCKISRFLTHENARNLVQNLFRPLLLLQKGLYRRGQLFGIDGFLRAASAASYAHLIASMTIRFDGGGTLLAIGSAGFRV
jgi:hypothetical protein